MRPIQTSNNNLFSDGNPATGTLGTLVDAEWLNGVQGELLAIIQAAGITPGVATDQVLTAINKLIAAAVNTSGVKVPCRAATTANLAALSGLLTVDGVVLVAGDRVLVKNQTTGSQNGIYIAAAGAWARAADVDASAELVSGMLVSVAEGTANADSTWMLATDGAIVLGTTALTWLNIKATVDLSAYATLDWVKSLGWGVTDSTAQISDLDSASVPSGVYYAPSSAVGTKPIAASGIVLHRVYDTAGFQLFQPQGVDRIFYRRRTGSAWQAWQELASLSSILPNIPVRQTVLGGPVDTSGLPSFLPATSASLSITSQLVTASAPLVVDSAAGFNGTGAIDRVGISTSNLTWAGLSANATNYLYVDVAANGTLTPGSTTVAPIYQQGGAPVTTANQATFNIAQMQMFVGNGATAPQTYRVFVGEAVTGASTVTSTVAYAYMGQTVIPDTATLPSGGTPTTKSHNLGVSPQIIEMYITNLTTDNGWAVGDRLYNPFAVSGSSYAPPQIMPNRNALYFVAAWGYGTFNKSSGVVYGVTATNWSYGFIVKRGW